jgi:hypothetical protein
MAEAVDVMENESFFVTVRQHIYGCLKVDPDKQIRDMQVR